LIFWQFSYLMIGKSLDDEDLVAHGHEKFIRTAVNSAERGDITDRDNNILASDMEAYRVALIIDEDYPNHVEDVEKVASVLNEVLGMNEDEVIEKIDQRIEEERYTVKLARAVRNRTYNQTMMLE